MRFGAIVAAMLVVAAAPAGAVTLDDFNRADAPVLGSNWTDVYGSAEIIDGQARRTDGTFGTSMAIFNGGSGDTVSFDLALGGSGVQFGGALLNYGNGNNYFIKVQANAGNTFDHYGFYTGINDQVGLFGGLAATFTSARVTASVVGSLATLTIMPNVGDVQTYTYDYGVALTGTGIGLAFFGDSRLDNFADGATIAAVPEPATWAMLILGFGVVGGGLRRRARGTLATA